MPSLDNVEMYVITENMDWAPLLLSCPLSLTSHPVSRLTLFFLAIDGPRSPLRIKYSKWKQLSEARTSNIPLKQHATCQSQQNARTLIWFSFDEAQMPGNNYPLGGRRD